MSKSPVLTTEYAQALNAVDLHLLGVDHGRYESDQWTTQVRGITDDHYAIVSNAIGALQPGDVLAIEPAGFKRDQAEYRTLEDLVSFNVPKGVYGDMPPHDRLDAAGVFKAARNTFRTNNFVHGVAVQALLREAPIPVHRAEASRADFKKVADLLPYLAPDEQSRAEMGLYYRRVKILDCLGDIALGMANSRPADAADEQAQPVLLAMHCPGHTLWLAEFLHQSDVAFQIDIPRVPRA